MHKVHEDRVELLGVGDGVEADGPDPAGHDAPRADLARVAALGRVPANVQHHRVLLGDQPDTLVKRHRV